jgi:hypothetical protein
MESEERLAGFQIQTSAFDVGSLLFDLQAFVSELEQKHPNFLRRYGRGAGVGRSRGVALGLGVGVGVGVAVGVGVTLGVGVGVGVPPCTYLIVA